MSPLPFLTVVAAGARVQAPFTLSETWTWPARLYWANQPTSRSPAPTALVKLTVLDATRDEVVNAEPWTYEAPEAAAAGTAGRPTKAPRASNGTSHQAVPLRPSGPCRNVLLGPVPGTGPRCRVAGQPASASRMQPASRRRLRLSIRRMYEVRVRRHRLAVDRAGRTLRACAPSSRSTPSLDVCRARACARSTCRAPAIAWSRRQDHRGAT